MESFTIICDRDNVAVALKDMPPGTSVDTGSEVILIQDPIKFGHKFAIRDIKTGEHVIKYCESIGVATQDIGKGQHVHTHNLVSMRARRSP